MTNLAVFDTGVFFTLMFLIPVKAFFDMSTAGPYDLFFKTMGECDDKGLNLVHTDHRFTKYNRTAIVYNGNATLPKGVNNKVKLQLDLSIKGNGGWKHIHHLNLGPLCSAIKSWLPKLLERGAKAVGMKPPYKCFLPPGNYTVRNLEINYEITKLLPIAPYKEFMADLSFYWKEEKVKLGCIRIYLDTVPKGTV